MWNLIHFCNGKASTTMVLYLPFIETKKLKPCINGYSTFCNGKAFT